MSLDNLANLPFQHVKESFQVREPHIVRERPAVTDH